MYGVINSVNSVEDALMLGDIVSSTREQPTAVDCSTMLVGTTKALVPRIHAVIETMMRHDSELRDLWTDACASPLDVDDLVQESQTLETQSYEGHAEVSAVTMVHRTLAEEAHEQQQCIEEIQSEHDALLTCLREVENCKKDTCAACVDAERTLDLLRYRAREEYQEFRSELEHSQMEATRSENQATAALQSLLRSEADSVHLLERVSCAGEAAAVETLRRSSLISDLEGRCSRHEEQLTEETKHSHLVRYETAETRTETLALEGTLNLLASHVANSERYLEDAEGKALGVVAELWDTTASVAGLRAEIVAQQRVAQEFSLELSTAVREEGFLEQRLQAAEREAYATHRLLSESPPPAGTIGGQAEKNVKSVALRDLRASQERAVSQALRSAWEAEVTDLQATEKQLEVLETNWACLRTWLLRLTMVAQHWYSIVPRGRFSTELPPLPTEAAWNTERSAPDAMRALCACFEAIAVETCSFMENHNFEFDPEVDNLSDSSPLTSGRCVVAR